MSLGVGSVSVTRVAELESWVFPTSEMFPTLDDTTTGSVAGPTVDFSIATYVVRSAGTTVLVDAGNGNHKHRTVLSAHDGFETDYLATSRQTCARCPRQGTRRATWWSRSRTTGSSR